MFDIVHDDASEHLPIQDTDDPMEDSDSAEILDMVEPQPRSRAEEREALRAAKRALKEEKRKQLEQERTHQAEQLQPLSRLGKSSGKDDILEIDLHINALLDHTEGLSRNVLMNTQLTEFRIVMDRYQRKPGQRIVFIYGRGEELLRENIIKELQRRYRSCVYEDASLQKYGYGATLVTIR